MKKEKRNKIIVGIAVAILLVFGIISIGGLFFTSSNQQEIAVPDKEVEDSKELELSDTRRELEKLYEERGTKKNLSGKQIFELEKYEIPFFPELLKEYVFEDRMDVYLTEIRKIAKKKGEYDFLYNAISDRLIGEYQDYKKELSEEDCERFLEIINLCKKRLETAEVWEELEKEPDEEPREEAIETETPTPIRLTDTRKKLEAILEERGYHNSRSDREMDFLEDNYDIPLFMESSQNGFEESYNSYLGKMEKLAKKQGEWDLLYEALSDHLIWNYNNYRSKLTEKQCERMLKLIKLCKKRENTAKTYAR